MADTLVILGGIVFSDFAIPDKINFGGEHKLSIKRNIGGQRIINPLGPDPDPITWTGKFRGPAALGNSLAVDAMRSAGTPVPLSWLGLSYLVIVRKFTASTEKYYEVPYTVTCEVVTDGSAPAAGPIASLTSLVGGDLSSLLAIPQAAALPAVATLNSLVSAQPTLDGAASTILGPLSNATGAAQAALSASIAADDAIAAIGAASGVAGVVAGAGTAVASAASLQATIAALANASSLRNGLDLANRVGTNLVTGGI